jgi:hypothetical protein
MKATAAAAELNAFWNGWFERDGTHAKELKEGNAYSFVLDLSRYAYIPKQAARPDQPMREAILSAFEEGRKTIEFVIRPILHGGLLRFAENQPADERLEVDIAKLLEPKDGSTEGWMQSRYDEFRKGRIPLPEFARQVQAGKVTFRLVAQQAGCGWISVSIWDEIGLIPLDHINQTVKIGDREGLTVSCPEPQQIPSGLTTLLDASLDLASSGPLKADAAFHIIEPSPHHKSLILFAGQKEIAHPADSDKKPGVEIYAWETESKLSSYIQDRDQLRVKIDEARKRAEQQEFSYRDVAVELRMKIFSGLTEKDTEEARKAERAFRDLVRRTRRPPIVFVRMRNEKGYPVYLPLGILGARSRDPFLDKRITLVQPLPRERYPGNKPLIKSWTLGIPQGFEETQPACNEALQQLEPSCPPCLKFLRDIESVKGYFTECLPFATGANPEGILLLAHHSGGNLWFDNQGNRITREHMRRCFPPGSIAIISACSVGGAEGNNSEILEKLNRNGVDAMILSPFPVQIDYGTMLTVHIVQVINRAWQDARTLSVAEIFDEATEKTAAYFKDRQGLRLEEMALEFLIVGDYRLRLSPR